MGELIDAVNGDRLGDVFVGDVGFGKEDSLVESVHVGGFLLGEDEGGAAQKVI